MNVELKQVTVDEKEILRNLLEKYDYEFSQWDKRIRHLYTSGTKLLMNTPMANLNL